MIHRRHFLSGAAALSATALMPRAFAQNGTTTVWSGFPAGGLGDQVTRPLLERLKGRHPSTLLLDSKPGAGGRIAAEFVKRAPPDGSTLLQVPSSPMTLFPALYKRLPYDPLKDFVPVAPLCSYTFSLTAGPGLPAEVKTVEDFLKWAKANPGAANYGVPAAGSVLHFAGMMLERAAGIDIKSIPYKGGAPLLQDLMGGQVPVAFNVVSEVLPHVRSGKLRSLAVTSPQRWTALPEVPTLVELGFKDISFIEYLGWYAPAKTPMDAVRRLNAAVQEALQTPEMQEVLTKNGLLALRESPEAFAARVRQDIERWRPIVQATGFTPDE